MKFFAAVGGTNSKNNKGDLHYLINKKKNSESRINFGPNFNQTQRVPENKK